MKGYFSHLLFSLSLAVINEATPSRTPIKDALRNKRSLVVDSGHKHHQSLPETMKRSKIPNFGLHKRGGFDTLDLDALFNDPIFAEMAAEEAEDNHFSNAIPPSFPSFEPEPFHPHKDEMSNVIPGALGPIGEQPRGDRMEQISGKMLDEFLWFMELKEAGLLDNCNVFKKR